MLFCFFLPLFSFFVEEGKIRLTGHSHSPFAHFVWSVLVCVCVCARVPLAAVFCLFVRLPVSAVRLFVFAFSGCVFCPSGLGFPGLGRLCLLRPFFGRLSTRCLVFFLFSCYCFLGLLCLQLFTQSSGSCHAHTCPTHRAVKTRPAPE